MQTLYIFIQNAAMTATHRIIRLGLWENNEHQDHRAFWLWPSDPIVYVSSHCNDLCDSQPQGQGSMGGFHWSSIHENYMFLAWSCQRSQQIWSYLSAKKTPNANTILHGLGGYCAYPYQCEYDGSPYCPKSRSLENTLDAYYFNARGLLFNRH